MDGSTRPSGALVPGAGQSSTATPEHARALEAFENLDYRDLFWPRRRYEDRCDRIALRAFLPPSGGRLIEVGAGFGRLADEYRGYREVVLLDPSEALLEAAREALSGDPRIAVVAGVAEQLPLPDASVDAVVCVRVLHQFRDPRPVIAEFARVLRPGGVLVLEAANKRNLKSVLGYLARRTRTSPLRRGSEKDWGVHLRGSRGSGEEDAPPQWRSTTAWLHAPADVRDWLREAGFHVGPARSVGLLRPAVLTRHLPLGLLVGLERVLQPGLAPVTPGPSLFLRAVRRGGG